MEKLDFLLKQATTKEGLTVIILVLALIIVLSLNHRFRLYVQEQILKSEKGELLRGRIYKSIKDLEDSDVDDRMIAVIAQIIHSLPVLSIIPELFVVSILRWYVQKIFDQVKDLLHYTPSDDEKGGK